MPSAAQVFKSIRESLEAIRCDDLQEFPVAASVGEYVRQGDVLIHKLAEPEGKPALVQLQLAPGTTKGSRHILSHDRVEYFTRSNGALTGPCLRVTEPVTVTHPEHGDWLLGPGCYGITYERAFADELRRARD
jgi:hypothetical protein